jgi:hypothetical protein
MPNRVAAIKKPLKIPKAVSDKGKSINELKKALWTIFSKWIRARDNYICYTCGKPGNHAGHYVPQSKGNALRWNEKNVHCQCMSCNCYKSGNLSVYALNLEKQYGAGILQEFDVIKHTVYKPTRDELEEKIAHYRGLLANKLERGEV